MSTDTQSGDGPSVPAIVLDDIAVYDAERPAFDATRTESARSSGERMRVWLVATLDVALTCEDYLSGPSRRLAVFATTDGDVSIRWASDSAARVDGNLAHSLIEPTERIRDAEPPVRQALATRVEEIHEGSV